jgi:hypothetical protein
MPRPALTAPRHDATAALSLECVALLHRSMSKVLCDIRRNPIAQPVCMLNDATVHIEDAASCGYRYTIATRLDVRSTT